MRARQNGFLLPYALVVVLLVTFSLALVAASLEARLRQLRHDERSLALGALLDAAVADAAAQLSFDAGYGGSDWQELGAGRYAVAVQPLDYRRRRVVVRSTGLKGREAAEVIVTLHSARPPSVADWRSLPWAEAQ